MTQLFISDAGLTTDPTDVRPDPTHILRCRSWIEKYCIPRKTINESRTSYGLKHVVEHWYRTRGSENDYYVTNGAFIQATVDLGYRYKHHGGASPNCDFNISFPRRGTDLYDEAFSEEIV